MKILSAILFLIAVVPAHAEFKFENPLIEIDADLNAKVLVQDFKFTNTGNKPVKITQASGDCVCVKVEVAGGKLTYAPGDTGILRATFEVGSFQGAVVKPINVWLDGADPEDTPSASASLRMNIPVIIQLEPKSLKWETGGSAEPKTIDVTMDYKQPIHITSVSTSNESFSARVITVEEGKHYKVEVTPVGTAIAGLSIVRIETDVDVEKQRVQQGFALVSNPPSKP